MKKRAKTAAIFCSVLILGVFMTACNDSPSEVPKKTQQPATLEAGAQATMIAVLAATEAAQPPATIAYMEVEPTPIPTPTPNPNPVISGKIPALANIPAPANPPLGAKLTGQLGGVVEGVSAAALSPNKNWLALSNRYQIWLMEVSTGKFSTYFISSADPEERGAATLSWAPDSRKLAAGSYHGIINMWRWDSIENRLRPGPQRLEPYSLAVNFGEQVEASFSPDGKMVAGLGSEGTLVIWDSETGNQTYKFDTGYAGFFSWSPDSKLIADEYLNVHSLVDGKTYGPNGKVQISSYRPQGVNWSPDGKQIAVSAEDFQVARYAAPLAGSPPWNLTKLLGQADYADSQSISRDVLKLGKRLAYSPDSKWLAIANTPAPGKISIWDAGTGKELFEVSASSKAINTLGWPVPGLFYAGGDDGVLRFWQVS